MMNEITITEIIEHEDGSATVKLDLDDKIYGQIFSEGFIYLLRKGLQMETEHSDVEINGS